MGTKAAIGGGIVLPCRADWRALSRLATTAARVVLPDPGIPDTAMRYRSVGGSVWNLAPEICQLSLYLVCLLSEAGDLPQVFSTRRVTCSSIVYITDTYIAQQPNWLVFKSRSLVMCLAKVTVFEAGKHFAEATYLAIMTWGLSLIG